VGEIKLMACPLDYVPANLTINTDAKNVFAVVLVLCGYLAFAVIDFVLRYKRSVFFIKPHSAAAVAKAATSTT
jgi:hypothetical protein